MEARSHVLKWLHFVVHYCSRARGFKSSLEHAYFYVFCNSQSPNNSP